MSGVVLDLAILHTNDFDMKGLPTAGWVLVAALAIGIIAWLLRALLAAFP